MFTFTHHVDYRVKDRPLGRIPRRNFVTSLIRDRSLPSINLYLRVPWWRGEGIYEGLLESPSTGGDPSDETE